jgi:hypothetical protein
MGATLNKENHDENKRRETQVIFLQMISLPELEIVHRIIVADVLYHATE